MNLKSLLFIFLIAISSLSCEKEIDYSVPLTVNQINAYIWDVVEEKGVFDWKDATDYFLWSAIVQGEGSASIGYGFFDPNMESVDLVEANKEDKQAVIDLVLNSESDELNILTFDDIYVNGIDELTYISLKVELLQTVTLLRNSEHVRYLEANYDKILE